PDDDYTSIYIDSFISDVRETKLGPEVTTGDIPNVSEEKLKDLDEEGIVRIGAEVGPSDILVGKISPKGEAELTSEERLLRAIFGEKAKEVKDSSLRMEHGKRGRVIGVKIFSRELGHKLAPGVIKRIEVEIAQIRRVQAGDKLAGRHGNKGVISKVLPVEEMPFMEDGTPIDMIINPLTVISRMNLGQVLETHLGWAAKNLDYHAVTPGLSGFCHIANLESVTFKPDYRYPEGKQSEIFGDHEYAKLLEEYPAIQKYTIMKDGRFIDFDFRPPFIAKTTQVKATKLKGYAFSGHGPIEEVTVSIDREKPISATLYQPASGAWALWSYHIPDDLKPGSHTVIVNGRD
ncbi:hypothetical protein LCGC14_3095550, partial [marine sediment metagenome]